MKSFWTKSPFVQEGERSNFICIGVSKFLSDEFDPLGFISRAHQVIINNEVIGGKWSCFVLDGNGYHFIGQRKKRCDARIFTQVEISKRYNI